MKTMTVFYQASNGGTGVAPQVDVFKPDKTQDMAQSGVATEIGATGRYYKTFDADAPDWFCEINDTAGGKAIKHYGKDVYDSHGIADAVADVATGVSSVASAVATLQSIVTGVDAVVNGVATDVTSLVVAVTALSAQLTTVESIVVETKTPPMIG